MKLISTFIVIVLLSGCQSKEQSVVISQNSISIAMQIYAISSKIFDDILPRKREFGGNGIEKRKIIR